MLLSLPVVYLFRTNIGLAAWFVGVAVWVTSRKTESLFGAPPNDLWAWVLLLLAVPAFVTRLREDARGYGFLLASTALALAAAFSLGQTDDLGARSFWRCSFAGYWSVVYLVGIVSWRGWSQPRPHPFVGAGWIGILSLGVFLSFQASWRTRQWQNAVDLVPRHFPDLLAGGIQVAWVAAAIAFAAYALWKHRHLNLAPAAFAPAVVAAWAVSKTSANPVAAALVVNLFLLAVGILTLLRGIRAGRVYEANLGMVVVAILAIARFFDSDLEFVIRGVAFIAIGLGFLVTNLVVLKRKARA